MLKQLIKPKVVVLIKCQFSHCVIKAGSNAPLFIQWLKLQKEIMSTLGYKNASHFFTEVLMAEKPENVDEFLKEMKVICVF